MIKLKPQEELLFTMLNERELVVLVQDHLPYDTHLFQQLITPYLPELKGYCVKLLNNQSDAEDVVQDILIKTLNNLKTFKWIISFRAWLFKIAYNECINKIRERRWDIIDNDEEYLENLIDGESHNEDPALVLAELIQYLSLTDRNIMLLRYRSELSFQEIANIHHLKLSAVKMRHKRVIEFLKEKLK